MRDKIVRIISFQNAQNYGAILQAFGLYKVIERMGFADVRFINYNPNYLKKRYNLFSLFTHFNEYSTVVKLKYILTLPFILYYRNKRNNAISKSRRNLIKQTSVELHNLDDINNERCDYLICGSDQIWSTWITHTPDPVFYGKGNYLGIQKCIAYAPSSEISTFQNESNIVLIKDYLKGFDAISVREERIKKEIQKLTEKEVSLCVDPTILCGADDFLEVASNRIVKNPYVVVYAYNPYDPLINKIINSIPSVENYEVHYLTFGSLGLKSLTNDKLHAEVGIEDFLSFFKFASYVVTNSFHGLAFSLLFEKPFNVGFVEGISGRVESLLFQLGLNDRLIKDNNISWSPIDFNLVKSTLTKIREDSMSYLENSLL